MKKYKIVITETLSRVVEVEAEDWSDAIEKVEADYWDSKIILDSNDYLCTDFDWDSEPTITMTDGNNEWRL